VRESTRGIEAAASALIAGWRVGSSTLDRSGIAACFGAYNTSVKIVRAESQVDVPSGKRSDGAVHQVQKRIARRQYFFDHTTN
jgi:hypothetical protein